jgi:5-hydroxyisourate hydrolase-like protein (transthyretin family)
MATAQAPKRVTKGSVQYWPVKVFDAFETINSLTGLDLRFDLYKADDAETQIITNASASNNGMIALPLIDTGSLDEGLYKLYISFVASPQTPKLGPFYFQVDD